MCLADADELENQHWSTSVDGNDGYGYFKEIKDVLT